MRFLGKGKRWNEERGFGFFERDDRQGDVFCHISTLRQSGLQGIVDGASYEFDISEDPLTGKMRASNVKWISNE